ncbi:hypothetical protein ABZY81_39420 [Streptomyces sp. NPDC006514]|uniref:hypothetical protein n=1 Tax=Streptomyces sp. NPDC006514 TaxID=3154308 RepID=UPI0033A38010
MTEDDGLMGPGRRCLRDQLGKLLKRSGLTQNQAIRRANQRKPGTVQTLKAQTVSDWLAGNPPAVFDPLWVLAEVFLIAAGRQAPEELKDKSRQPAAGLEYEKTLEALGAWHATKGFWKQVWQDARDEPGPAPDPRLRAYLTAARQAATTHPYAWPDEDTPPGASPVPLPLEDVYVLQEAHPENIAAPIDANSPEDKGEEGDDMSVTADAGSPKTAGFPAARPSYQPAGHVFNGAEQQCVLLAGPGGGKSTQARAHLTAAADRWLHRLDRARADRVDTAVPVLAKATALVGDAPLPQALASAVTADLAEVALLPDLTGLFARHPIPRTPWLVVVDGLDEIPERHTRARLMRALAAATATHPSLYRFIILTRPLPAGELDVLGSGTTRYILQPFKPADLHGYALRCFRHLVKRASGDDGPDHHATAFIAQLTRSRLNALARTPLMAFMLTRLYAANPGRPLPYGRSAVYAAFVGLIYKHNPHKNIAHAHAMAIRELTRRYHDPGERQTAEQAACRAARHLTEIIEYLAHERLYGNTDPAGRIAATHPTARRPVIVEERDWVRFLNELLRPTGLLTHYGSDLEFLHQTFMAYLAARHAARDEQAREQLLDALFPLGRQPRVPAVEPSYLGFLLDALLASPGHIAAETSRRIEILTQDESAVVCEFLVQQVDLRTGLPAEPTARQLTRFAQGRPFYAVHRVAAARGLANIDGYRVAGAECLTAFAGAPNLDAKVRVQAARHLADVDGYRVAGADCLIAFADNPRHAADIRVAAARGLADVDGYKAAGADRLIAIANDTTHSANIRAEAARDLAAVDAYQVLGADLLERLARDTAHDASFRLRVAGDLAKLDRGRGADLLARLTNDTTLSAEMRLEAARTLARLDKQRGADLFAGLAEDAAIRLVVRLEAARTLARLDRQRGADLLTRFAAEDTTIAAHVRVQAARALAGVAGYQNLAASLLESLAVDVDLRVYVRMDAAWDLAEVDGGHERGADLLARLARDTTHEADVRAEAARILVRVEGCRDRGADLLVRLADDTTLCAAVRLQVARELAQLDRERGADLLARLADDTTFYAAVRLQVARELAQLDRERGADLLARLADDTTLYAHVRLQAARILSKMAPYEGVGADRLIALADDTTHETHIRIDAAHDLADVDGFKDRGAELLEQARTTSCICRSGKPKGSDAAGDVPGAPDGCGRGCDQG